jgi:hypothetical protein
MACPADVELVPQHCLERNILKSQNKRIYLLGVFN